MAGAISGATGGAPATSGRGCISLGTAHSPPTTAATASSPSAIQVLPVPDRRGWGIISSLSIAGASTSEVVPTSGCIPSIGQFASSASSGWPPDGGGGGTNAGGGSGRGVGASARPN